MTLRDDIVAIVAHGGVKVSRVYWSFRDLDRARIDAALLGLYADSVLVRVNDVVHRPAHRLALRCKRCHEPRGMDVMLDTGVCLRCASEESSPQAKTKTERTCPCCQQEWTVAAYGPGVYCPPCARVKRQKIAAKARAKYRADRRTDPAFARSMAKLRQPNGAKYLSRGGRDEPA